jgi:hypothetical protein
MIRPFLAVLVLALAALPANTQETSSRAGPRPILNLEAEIALARTAAPPSVSAGARALVLTDSGYTVADYGSADRGVTCVVNRSWRASIEPHCYDAEAAATIMPMELRRNTLRHQSRTEEEIEREIAAGLASGAFKLPSRPALTYMMSARQVLYDEEGRRVGAWRPHLMLYYPYLTNAGVGLAAAPDMRVGMVSDEGQPTATLILIMPGFAPEPDPQPR